MNMKSYPDIEDLINDLSFKAWVLNGDPHQKNKWERWLKNHPEQSELISQAKDILLNLKGHSKPWDEQRKANVLAKINTQISVNHLGKNGRSEKSHFLPVGFLVACSSLILLLFSLVLLNVLDQPSEDPSGLLADSSEWTIKSNPKGQKSTFLLPDGSKIKLNAASDIQYESGFGISHRNIYLDGEAFFEVASDTLLPFKVYCEGLVTEAVGTSFNISSYKNESPQVQLATGKIKVYLPENQEDALMLSPGEGVFLDKNHHLQITKFDYEMAFLWKDGILVFNKTEFSKSVNRLERWYGVEVSIINPPKKEKRISGKFKNDYLSDVLETLGYAYGFNYRIHNKKVELVFH
jgi:transmembrane sensor